jgi:hypothetical protein
MKTIVILICLLGFCSSSFPQDDYYDLEQPEVTITIFSNNGTKMFGKFLALTDTSLLIWAPQEKFNLQNAAAITEFAVNRIDSIHLKKEGSFWTGAIAGFGLATAVFTLIGLATQDDDAWFELSFSQFVIGSAVVFGLPAGLIGGLLGSLSGVDEKYYINGDVAIYRKVKDEISKYALYKTGKTVLQF